MSRPVAIEPGLRGKLLLASAAAVLVVVLVSAVAATLFFVDRQEAAQRSRSLAIADTLAIQLERILALELPLKDLQGFDVQCDEALQRHQGLSLALVVDPTGRVLFRSTRQAPAPLLPPLPTLLAHGQAGASSAAQLHLRTSDGLSELVVTAVRTRDPAPVALVVVGYPVQALEAERNHLLMRVGAAATLALLLVLGLLHVVLSHMLMRPLGRVVDAVTRMRDGDRHAQVMLPARRGDELDVLAEGFNGLVQTVAEREHELVAARDAAEQANRAKSQFLATMSHELRTPLNAVLGLSDLLARSALDARQQKMLGQVRSSGRLLANIIADLLDRSVIEAGRLRVAELPYHLRETVVEAVERFRAEAHSRGLWLALEIDPALPPRLLGDALRVQQVLGNLLSNALKFTEHGGVRVTVSPAAHAVRVAVADTGIGIDEDFLPHVYEAFRQADGSLSRRFGGSGLGLSIARDLCDAMGGRIDVSTRPGQGTTFWFELPLRLPAAAETVDAPGQAAVAAVAAPPPPARPRELLLIEDNEVNRAFVLACLAADETCNVVVARDGTEGLARLIDRRYDALLLDWQLPGIDGAALLAALRGIEQREGWPRTPVIVLTAHASPEQRQACLAAGVDDFLAKPFSPDALEAALNRQWVRAAGVDKRADIDTGIGADTAG